MKNLVEEEAAPEEERVDPDVARMLFLAIQASQPGRVAAQARTAADVPGQRHRSHVRR